MAFAENVRYFYEETHRWKNLTQYLLALVCSCLANFTVEYNRS